MQRPREPNKTFYRIFSSLILPSAQRYHSIQCTMEASYLQKNFSNKFKLIGVHSESSSHGFTLSFFEFDCRKNLVSFDFARGLSACFMYPSDHSSVFIHTEKSQRDPDLFLSLSDKSPFRIIIL